MLPRALIVRLLILAGSALAADLQAMAVGSLFKVDFTANTGGGCAYVGQATMQSILNDALNLGNIGLSLVTDYSNGVEPAMRLLDSYFKSTTGRLTTTQLGQIQSSYQKVFNWVQNGGVYDGSRTTKPLLFCYHSWLVKKTMSSQAIDINGNPISTKDPTTQQQVPLLMKDDPNYQLLLDQETANQRANGIHQIGTPVSSPGSTLLRDSGACGDHFIDNVFQHQYWSQNHLAYLFDEIYGPGDQGYCSVSGNTAATQDVLDPSTITLCPIAFGATGNSNPVTKAPAVNYVGRLEGTPNPMTRATPPGATSQQLTAVLPTAVTLFHELFHLVLGSANTVPTDVNEVYGLLKGPAQIVGLAFYRAVRNPESFALAAVAYDYTKNWPANSAGQPIEFYTGYTMQG